MRINQIISECSDATYGMCMESGSQSPIRIIEDTLGHLGHAMVDKPTVARNGGIEESPSASERAQIAKLLNRHSKLLAAYEKLDEEARSLGSDYNDLLSHIAGDRR